MKNKITGEPLIGANIIVDEIGGGTSSDAYGFYSIEVFHKTTLLLKASFVGYKLYKHQLKVDNDMRLDILLEPGIELSEVEISAKMKIEERLDLGMIEIPIKQAINMPMLGEPDILRTMQLLPGIQGGADGRSGLYVRGGSPDQNLFMLDGTPLYYVNHLGGFVSVFHPDILKNIKLYKGGYPARFGGRLSSVVDLRMKEGDKKEFHGSYGVGLISGDVTLEGPIKIDKTSFIVSARRVWLDFLLRPITKISFQGASMGYNFYDVYGKVSHNIDQRNRVYFSFYGGDDRLGYYYSKRNEKIRSNTKYIWGNIQSTVRWNSLISSKLNSDITTFYTRYRYKNRLFYKSGDQNGEDISRTAVHEIGLKADFNWHLKRRMTIRFGAGIAENWFVPGQETYETTGKTEYSKIIIGAQNRTKALNSYAYVESQYHPFKWFSMNVGARLANFYVEDVNYFSFEPRFISNINLNKYGAIKFGYTEMMQPVHMLSYSGSAFPDDIWLPSTSKISPSFSKQYSVGYTKSIKKGKMEFSLEVYKKEMKKLIEVKGGVTLVNTKSWEENIERGGIGNSQGIEFLLQKNSGKTTGWISYTLSKAERQFENIDNGNSYPFKYDRLHDLSIVFSQAVSKAIDLSATWVYGSGYPTTLHNGVYLAAQPKDREIKSPEADIFEVTGEAYLYPGKNWLRMRDYHRLDLGLNLRKEKKSKKGNKQERTWTIGVYNAYNRQNAVFYYFDNVNDDLSKPIVLYQQSGFPFLPTVKYSVKF